MHFFTLLLTIPTLLLFCLLVLLAGDARGSSLPGPAPCVEILDSQESASDPRLHIFGPPAAIPGEGCHLDFPQVFGKSFAFSLYGKDWILDDTEGSITLELWFDEPVAGVWWKEAGLWVAHEGEVDVFGEMQVGDQVAPLNSGLRALAVVRHGRDRAPRADAARDPHAAKRSARGHLEREARPGRRRQEEREPLVPYRSRARHAGPDGARHARTRLGRSLSFLIPSPGT